MSTQLSRWQGDFNFGGTIGPVLAGYIIGSGDSYKTGFICGAVVIRKFFALFSLWGCRKNLAHKIFLVNGS